VTPATRSAWLALARWGPFLVPPLYLALVLWLQPPDRLTPGWSGPMFRAVYDDWDLTAMALRGLNASLGRTAGRADNPEQVPADDYARALDEPRPLQPRYYLEYPHAALLLFRVPYWIEPVTDVPAAGLDGGYGNIVEHTPRNDAERRLWRQFRRVIQTYLVMMCVATLLLLAVVRAGYEPGAEVSGPLVLMVLPAAVYFSLNRFDVVLALLTALGFACLGRRRYLLSGLLFGTATAIKVYPALLVPLVLRFLWPSRRDALAWLAAYGAAVAACFLPPLVLSGWQAVWEPFRFQLTRPPMGMMAYGHFLPQRLEENDLLGRSFRLGTVVLAVLLLAWRRPPDLSGLLRRGAIALIVFISVPVFYSPQWILWLLPLLVPLVMRQWALAVPIVALDLVTWGTFPLGLQVPEAVAVYARYAVLACLVAALAWAERRRPAPAAVGVA
jgi:hypothetical protein